MKPDTDTALWQSIATLAAQAPANRTGMAIWEAFRLWDGAHPNAGADDAQAAYERIRRLFGVAA